MKLSIGIVGLPNVGKSTLFKLLTQQDITIANYPFATIDPNIGVVAVPDERLDKLTKISNSAKRIPAVVEFYDIAGLVKGASAGEGLGNQFLTHIRDCQAIVMAVRVFHDDNIIHVHDSVDPLRDIDIIESELALKDLETIEKRLKKAEGEAKTGDKKAKAAVEILQTALIKLNNGELLQDLASEEIIKELMLLTSKKQLFLFNGDESDVSEKVKNKVKSIGSDYVAMNLASASELAPLIQKAYEVLNLMSFFTTGETESRAWTIEKGAKAPQAAGVIHTDFEKKFIRAEVINTDKLLEAGGWNQAKQKGWLRLEGKEYVVQDGDVMVIRHG